MRVCVCTCVLLESLMAGESKNKKLFLSPQNDHMWKNSPARRRFLKKTNKQEKSIEEGRSSQTRPGKRGECCQFWWLWSMFIRATLKSTACFLYWTEHTWTHATFRTANNTLRRVLWHWSDERDIRWAVTKGWGKCCASCFGSARI